MKFVNNFFIPGVILLILDAIYISMIKDEFELQIASIQRVSMQIRPLGAIVCYLLLITGLWYFILRERRSIIEAFFFGIVIYGVYESTSYATLKNWSSKIFIMDTLWGGVLMGLTTYLTYKFTQK
jgi:uncharacterized membrane protein